MFMMRRLTAVMERAGDAITVPVPLHDELRRAR